MNTVKESTQEPALMSSLDQPKERGPGPVFITAIGLGVLILSSAGMVWGYRSLEQTLSQEAFSWEPEVSRAQAAEEARISRKDFSSKPYGLYRQVFSGRNVFDFPAPVATILSLEGPRSPGWLSAYKLVGIVLDSNPQAVIEQPGEGQTFFLYKGDHLAGAELSDIREGKVTRSYGGEDFELTP